MLSNMKQDTGQEEGTRQEVYKAWDWKDNKFTKVIRSGRGGTKGEKKQHDAGAPNYKWKLFQCIHFIWVWPLVKWTLQQAGHQGPYSMLRIGNILGFQPLTCCQPGSVHHTEPIRPPSQQATYINTREVEKGVSLEVRRVNINSQINVTAARETALRVMNTNPHRHINTHSHRVTYTQGKWEVREGGRSWD